MFHDWTPSLSGPCFRGAVPVACLWLSLWFWAWSLLGRCLSPLVLPLVLFRFVGVQLKEEKGTDPEPAVIQRSLFDQASPPVSLFWDFGSLHQKHRQSAGLRL